ncbi:MAG TPA: hypothetical protein VF530_06995 [Planctomycetota bacterium]
MPSRWNQALGALALVLFALLVLRTAGALARAPETNWDMLPAMALALEWEEQDPLELHRRTYAAARAELPPPVFAELTAAGVRQARFRDPLAFHEHLPFYRARVLYSLSVYALHRLGAPLSAATYQVSIASFVACALLFLLWARRHLPLPAAALFALGLAHLPALLNQAGTSSADALATLLLCAAGYLLLERRSWRGAAVLTLASLGARPDGVILIALLAAGLFALQPREERPPARALAVWVALGALLYLGLTRHAGEYGWWPLIQISFVEKAVHPAQLPTAVDWGAYGAILARQVASLPGEGYVTTGGGEVTGSTLAFLFAAVAALLVVEAWPRARDARRHAALLAALLATYLVRFALFPQLWDRFLAPFYALVPLCALALWRRRTSAA